MKCSHCKTEHKRSTMYRWDIKLCANNRRHRVFNVCRECDLALNRHMLIVMGDPKVNEKMDRYARR